MSRSISVHKEKKDGGTEIFREKILYREWARRFTIMEKYTQAITYFEKAIQSADDDKDVRLFLGLCKAQFNFTRYRIAVQISEKCMEIDPNNHQVKEMRVNTLYRMGEFCYSLIHAYNGLRQRKMPFELYIYRANETIETCVGRNTVPDALKRLLPWIKKLEEYRKVLIEKLTVEPDEFEGIDEDQSKFKVNDPVAKEEMYNAKLRKTIARIYLRHMAVEKEFRQRLLENKQTFESPNKESSKMLLHILQESFKNTEFRQSIIRMTSPIYVMLFARSARTFGHKMMIKNEEKIKKCNIIILADFLLRSLHAARMEGDYCLFFKYVERIKDKFDSYSNNMFPLKQKCLNALYKMIAWAYIDTRNLMSLRDEETKIRYLKHHLRVGTTRLPRQRELAWVKINTRQNALKTFRRRLSVASEPLELAWLFHDFSKFLIEIYRFDLARYYAKKARDSAVEAKCEQWILNASHMMMLVEICQNNRNEAKEAAINAIASAKKLGIDYLVDFYFRTLNIIDEVDFERLMITTDGIGIRQRIILELMPDELKNDVDFLFRSMEVVPAKRRLSVMPGCKPIDRKFKLPCRRNTILPCPPKDPEKKARQALLAQYAPSKERPGFIDFENYK
ncbi:outer dynein arm-docking complex subunit 4-like isoform X1 [Vespa crabro]|uniref:outer dynein arm-docking complex subunit 4-like isoform X1 n=1 Tax=Vespa crabro TaxID=7445 RepID=UPI001F0101EF|nr:outer dynein arm-docking complex subunit 4-like isoform X1 [Vespa crabro]